MGAYKSLNPTKQGFMTPYPFLPAEKLNYTCWNIAFLAQKVLKTHYWLKVNTRKKRSSGGTIWSAGVALNLDETLGSSAFNVHCLSLVYMISAKKHQTEQKKKKDTGIAHNCMFLIPLFNVIKFLSP